MWKNTEELYERDEDSSAVICRQYVISEMDKSGVI